MNLKKLKGSILKNLFLDKDVDIYYRNFQRKYPKFTAKNRLKAIKYIMRLNFAQYRRKNLNTVSKPSDIEKYLIDNINDNKFYYKNEYARLDVYKLLEKIKKYDVISFDIFDTALYRKVEYPNDIFNIISMEMQYDDFTNIRKKAEEIARLNKEEKEGHREVTLSEIYDVLETVFDIDRCWEKREENLEILLSIPNEYILLLFKELKKLGKCVVFTSDMYLSKSVLIKMLEKNGYDGYKKIYLSNEYNLRKGDGGLQQILLKDFKGKKVIHIGDNYSSDVDKSIQSGLEAIYNPSAKLDYRENNLDGLAASFYRAIIQTKLNNGLWNENIYFEHGFRIGGILTLGFCEYINKVIEEKNINKVLFCARDCEILYKIYNQFYKKIDVDSEYIEVSRYALMSITSERYLYDWVKRFVLRYAEQVKNKKTIKAVLEETGFCYLVNYLEDDDIDKFLFVSALNKNRLERFIINHKEIIEENNRSNKKAALKYFSEIIGEKENILIVDIGWSGTCITTLKYFIEKNCKNKIKNIYGTLMCTSRNLSLKNAIESEMISAYIYSPFDNLDLTRFMMPAKAGIKEQDLLHMPLEYMFTSKKGSLIRYLQNNKGEITFERSKHVHENIDEIEQIQRGMLAFVKTYRNFISGFEKLVRISPYTAFNPLVESIKHKEYIYNIYKNFSYDIFSAPYSDIKTDKFNNLFEEYNLKSLGNQDVKKSKNKILFITDSLQYYGAPRSLLRMCKVAINLGYHVNVWSSNYGPFIEEFIINKINVDIVTEKDLNKNNIIKFLKEYDMAVCNTINTDKYVKICGRYMPVVWYIREATNIMDFCKKNPERLYLLKHSKDIYCVSEYAAKALKKYNKNPIRIVHNCVEDENNMALPYISGSSEIVRFVQFGTIEYRKGYDVLISAYQAMPLEYRRKSELYFAGGFINSGTAYASYLFNRIEKDDNIHYLGIVKGEKNKIETLSKMDVIVVASRDESCSLVALEGAMLAKPLIVTENVGAKYIVNKENGIIVKTDDVEELKNALIYMIEHRKKLNLMGIEARKTYEKKANMYSYTENMKKMFSRCNEKNTLKLKKKIFLDRIKFSYKRRKLVGLAEKILKRRITENVIISLTSHPGRINTIDKCINSLLNQSVVPKKIILWLSKKQFPGLDKDLPKGLLNLTTNKIFEIRWTEDDLGPHKKYYYVMQEFKEIPIIIVDDDVCYDKNFVKVLMKSYKKFPKCISCMRANFMMFKPDGNLREYKSWLMGYRILLDIPSYQLMPTGIGGVLYPPNILSRDTFNKKAIIENAFYCDDLWLKFNAVKNDIKTVIPMDYTSYKEIPNTQEVALWRLNVTKNNNDICIKNIINYYNKNGVDINNILNKMRKDRFK